MTQIFANALVSAAGYLLVGIGFSLVYTTGRFFHIAHGIVFTAGAYATYVLRVNAGLPLLVAILGGIIISTLLGVAIETVIYRPLRRRRATAATLLLASLGAYVGMQAIVVLLFGSGTQTFRLSSPVEGMNLVGARVTSVQIATVLAALASFIMMGLTLARSRIGKAIRAVASDPDLADAYGIKSDFVILIVFAVASALAGIAAVLISADSDISPAMGFRILLMAMIAVVVGGIGSPYGIALGAVTLALLQHLAAWWLSSRWQDAIAYTVLLIFLLLKPQGLFGGPMRKITV